MERNRKSGQNPPRVVAPIEEEEEEEEEVVVVVVVVVVVLCIVVECNFSVFHTIPHSILMNY